jgi:hypothetical protein
MRAKSMKKQPKKQKTEKRGFFAKASSEYSKAISVAKQSESKESKEALLKAEEDFFEASVKLFSMVIAVVKENDMEKRKMKKGKSR